MAQERVGDIGSGLPEERLSSLSEEELVLRCMSGKTSAVYVSELVCRYFPFIKSKAAVFCGFPAQYDDFVQEGLLGLINAVRGFDSGRGGKFSSYAYACIVNRMKTAASKQAFGISCSDGEEKGEDNSTPESIFIGRELLSGLEDRLSELEYGVCTLYAAGLSCAEISKKLGISRKAADNALGRARRKLRSELHQE